MFDSFKMMEADAENIIKMEEYEVDQIMRVHSIQRSEVQNPVTQLDEMYKYYSTIGTDCMVTGESTEKKQHQIQEDTAQLDREMITTPLHLQTLMLGVIHRFAPFQSGNFMPKWVEVTQAGITYFRNASTDKAQGFFPRHVVKDIYLMAPPENQKALLSKLRKSDLTKREEEITMMSNMFEVVIDMTELRVYIEM